MHKILKYIIVLVLLHCSTASWCQYDTVAVQAPEEEILEDVYEEKPSFSIITDKEPVTIKKLPQQKVEELKASDDYWYANLEPEKKQEKQETQAPRKGLFDADWFKTLLWLVVLFSFIGAVIWYLASSNIGLFRKDSKKIAEEEIEDDWTDDIFNINYDKEIQKAVSLQNYRLAVRLLYLRTLRDLSERNIIDYRFGKTNNDYVTALYGSNYYRDFFRLTRNFEYTWYGQFKPSAEVFEAMQADFAKFKNMIA